MAGILVRLASLSDSLTCMQTLWLASLSITGLQTLWLASHTYWLAFTTL